MSETETTTVAPKRTRRAKTNPTAKIVEKHAPEADLSAYLDKNPSKVNVAEAAWLIECTGLPVQGDQFELVAKVVQLVAGTAHRAFQRSEAAKKVHGK